MYLINLLTNLLIFKRIELFTIEQVEGWGEGKGGVGMTGG